MGWQERERANREFEEARLTRWSEQQQQERSKAKLTEKGKTITAEEILKTFGVARALEDVREDVWKEGEVKQEEGRRGWSLVSSPVPTLVNSVRYGWKEKQATIELSSDSAHLGIRVEFEDQDPSKPKIALAYSRPFLLEGLCLKEEKENMQEVLRRVGWKQLALDIRRGIRSNESWQHYLSEAEVKGLDGENKQEEFNGALIKLVVTNRPSYKRELFPLGEIRDSWSPLINQFPLQLREKGFLTVEDMKIWERQVKGPSLLSRARSVFSGKPR